MTWLWLSILSLVFFSLYEIGARFMGVNAKNVRLYAGLYNLTASCIAWTLLLIEAPIRIELSIGLLIITVINLIVWACFGRLEYFVHKEVEASTLSVILKLAPAISFIIGTIVFKEVLTLQKLVGVVIIVIANIWIVSVSEHIKLSKKGLWFALSLAGLLAVGWNLDKAVAPHYGLAFFTFLSFFAPALLNLLPGFKVREIAMEMSNGVWWKMFITAFLNVAGYATLVKALIIGESSRVTPIANATTPLVMLLGLLLLGERKGIQYKVLAGVLIFVGAYLLK